MKYAHISEERTQSIKDHVEGVAELASQYANDMMCDYAYKIGLAHDIGKYADDFQKRLEGSKVHFEHSSCGAIELGKLAKGNINLENMTYMLQYCVAGHHTGLPDGGSSVDSAESDNTLNAKLNRAKYYNGTSDYSSYKDEISLGLPDYSNLMQELGRSADKNEFIEKYAFFTRYLFSCLTDADFIDTERFCSPDTDRQLHADFTVAEEKTDAKLANLSSSRCETLLQKSRKSLQDQAVKNIISDSHIHILDMPTGSGKTLCSIKIALNLLNEKKKKRIIYVIPYTSIIEQTAKVFGDMFGEDIDIVQHHSNYCYDKDDNEEFDSTEKKLKRSTENWDAPLIITTSVQFFQSLYHYKGSRLRKLHNLADSVIIFDEVHMLPIECLQPCLRAIGFITKYLNSEALFLSATMPDFSEMLRRYGSGEKYNELIRDKSDFKYFRKCSYSYIGKTDPESIAEKTLGNTSSLIIVNSKKAARNTYDLLSGKKYHLSTYMTPKDRSETIKKIREDLEHNENITVVSTSLVEAGVDLSFDTVYREIAGLDSILQSGGRCNREGKQESGNVIIFETDDKLKGDIKIRASIVKDMLEKGKDIASEECIREYYNRLFSYLDEQIAGNTIAEMTNAFDSIPFRTYAENFKLIKDETISVIINNCDEVSKLLEQLKYGSKSAVRKLQPYSVALKIHGEFDKALKLGLIDDKVYGVFVLQNNVYYNKETGLDVDFQPDFICD